MLNLNRNGRWNDQDADKPDVNKPASRPLGTGTAPQPGSAGAVSARPAPSATPAREAAPPAATQDVVATQAAADAGSKLFVGVNIRLKGVEISNCDVLVIEGQVDATVNSKVMEISKPGTLTGTASIDVAEIHGEFSGELTARTKLVVHGTGRITGTIRYGKLVVAEGGVVSGELQQIDAAAPEARMPSPPLLAPDALAPSTARKAH